MRLPPLVHVAMPARTSAAGHSLERRFWKHVVVKDGCWGWSANKHRGYGLVTSGTWRNGGTFRQLRAPRVSWWIHYGDPGDGLFVCHHCGNPECTNPSHLFLGTPLDNMRDRSEKGRATAPRGSDHGNAKLTPEIVREIRALVGSASYREIGRRFSISPSTVRDIRHRTRWAHVD